MLKNVKKGLPTELVDEMLRTSSFLSSSSENENLGRLSCMSILSDWIYLGSLYSYTPVLITSATSDNLVNGKAIFNHFPHALNVLEILHSKVQKLTSTIVLYVAKWSENRLFLLMSL